MKTEFTGDIEVLARLMAESGFAVARGGYMCGDDGDLYPTWEITRPDAPLWEGVIEPWSEDPDNCDYAIEGEVQALFNLCHDAIQEWDYVGWKYIDIGR